MRINKEVFEEFRYVMSTYFYPYGISITFLRSSKSYVVSCNGLNHSNASEATELGYAISKAGKLIHSLNRVSLTSSYRYYEDDIYTGNLDINLDKINTYLVSILSSDSDTFATEIISYLKEWEE